MNEKPAAPGTTEKPWRIRVGQSFAFRDNCYWSLWSDKESASKWASADAAYAARSAAPELIRFEGVVEQDG